MDLLGKATCTVHLISASDQPGRKQIYHWIREGKSLLSLYILWLIHNVAYLHRRLLLRYTHVHKWWLIFTPVYVIEIHLFFWIWSLSTRSKKLGTLLHFTKAMKCILQFMFNSMEIFIFKFCYRVFSYFQTSKVFGLKST